MLVHMYGAVGDLDGFLELAKKRSIAIIEDASHAHGARWRQRRVGSLSSIGVFSMQQRKLLTCGEGGATITDDPILHDRMQQLRADGRRQKSESLRVGELELEPIGDILGRNRSLSEIQAAILVSRLPHLDAENEIRRRNGDLLTSLLESKGLGVGLRSCRHSSPVYYDYCFRVNREQFRYAPIEVIASAIAAELSISVEPIDAPLHQNRLFRHGVYRIPDGQTLKGAEAACQASLRIPHHVLLAPQEMMMVIADGFRKVAGSSADLVASFRPIPKTSNQG
jgi:dTDP-4-amino-4,6-dideoxygalactose transaminase